MKTKKVRPVLVESKERTNIWWSGHKIYYNRTPEEPRTPCYQLILISLEDEKIEVGDKYCVELFKVTGESIGLQLEKCKQIEDIWINNFDVASTRHIQNCRKVIATQSQLSPEYIQQFIEEYNEGEVKDVEIIGEMMALHGKVLLPCSPLNNESNSDMSIYKFYPKLKNGLITIVEKEGHILTDWLNSSEEDLEIILSKGITKQPILYTEEEVLKLLKRYGKQCNCLSAHIHNQYDNEKEGKIEFTHQLTEWFEQNKKK